MAKKQKKEKNINNEIVKKIKTKFLDLLVREWLNSPNKLWGGITPLQLIQKGDGQLILDAINEAEKLIPSEEVNKKNEPNNCRNSEEEIEPETILSRIENT